MDAVLKVIGIVGAAWLLLSVLVAIVWALGGKRIFRKPPLPTPLRPGDATVVFINGRRADKVDGIYTEAYDVERDGGF